MIKGNVRFNYKPEEIYSSMVKWRLMERTNDIYLRCIRLFKPPKVLRVIRLSTTLLQISREILWRMASFEPEDPTARGFFKPEM